MCCSPQPDIRHQAHDHSHHDLQDLGPCCHTNQQQPDPDCGQVGYIKGFACWRVVAFFGQPPAPAEQCHSRHHQLCRPQGMCFVWRQSHASAGCQHQVSKLQQIRLSHVNSWCRSICVSQSVPVPIRCFVCDLHVGTDGNLCWLCYPCHHMCPMPYVQCPCVTSTLQLICMLDCRLLTWACLECAQSIYRLMQP